MKRLSRSLKPSDISAPEAEKTPSRGGRPNTPLFFLILLGFFLLQSCGGKEATGVLETPHPVTDQWGKTREYRVYPPPVSGKVPLLVYFHGVMSENFRDIPTLKNYTGSPVEETGLIPFARANGILLVVPRPAYSYVFLGKRVQGWLPFEKEMDGIEKMIETVIAEFPVDEREVYLAGISAGAGICHQLANRNPERYNAILSHSQGYVGDGDRLLVPPKAGPGFGVVFCCNRGDYANLIAICESSEEKYRTAGYRTALLKNLPPEDHSWSKKSNRRFWRYLKQLGQYTHHSTQRSGSHP